jgi:hypothetical protein
MGQINMRDTRVEEVEQISDSDSDDLDPANRKSLLTVNSGIGQNSGIGEPTVGIFPNHVQQGPTYLIFHGGKQGWKKSTNLINDKNLQLSSLYVLIFTYIYT